MHKRKPLRSPVYLDRAAEFLERFYLERQQIFREDGVFVDGLPMFEQTFTLPKVALLLDCGNVDTIRQLCKKKGLGYFTDEHENWPFFSPYRLIPANELVVFLTENSRGIKPLWENVEELLWGGMIKSSRITEAMGGVPISKFDQVIREGMVPSFNISTGERSTYVLPIIATRDAFLKIMEEYFPRRKTHHAMSGLQLHNA